MSETKTAVQAAEEFLIQWDTPENINRYGPISHVNAAYILETARCLDDLAERIEKLRDRHETLADHLDLLEDLSHAHKVANDEHHYRIAQLEIHACDRGMEAMGFGQGVEYGGGDLIEPDVTAVKPREQNANQTIGEQTTDAEIQRYCEWIAELEKAISHYKAELKLRKRELQNEIDVWKERAEKAEAEVAETRRLLDADDGRTTLLSQIHRLTAERDAALESANFVRGTCDLWQKHTEQAEARMSIFVSMVERACKGAEFTDVGSQFALPIAQVQRLHRQHKAAEAELERIQQAREEEKIKVRQQNVINSPTAAEGELSITNERIEEMERRIAIAERDHRAMEWLRKMKHTLNYEASPELLFGGDSPGWYININQRTVQDPADAILAAADNKENKPDPAFNERRG